MGERKLLTKRMGGIAIFVVIVSVILTFFMYNISTRVSLSGDKVIIENIGVLAKKVKVLEERVKKLEEKIKAGEKNK